MSGDHQLAPWRALTHELSVPSELDMIVEALLGSNMHGLFVQDRESVRTFIDALEQSGETGDVVLLPEKDIFQLASSDDFATSERDHRLLDQIEVSSTYKKGFEALLGAVYLYDSKDELFNIWKRAPHGVTLVSRDGCIVDTNGRARYFRKSEEDKANSALLRRRNLVELRSREAEYSERFAKVRATYDQLENSLKRTADRFVAGNREDRERARQSRVDCARSCERDANARNAQGQP